jgi:hypothetical protein
MGETLDPSISDRTMAVFLAALSLDGILF